MQILLANPRGFCAGVDRAISIVEKRAGYLRRAKVCPSQKWCNNRYVVDSLRERGAIFIEQRNDKVFATQRGYGEFKGGWEFPGGKIEAW